MFSTAARLAFTAPSMDFEARERDYYADPHKTP
jgi:hypothetical protein